MKNLVRIIALSLACFILLLANSPSTKAQTPASKTQKAPSPAKPPQHKSMRNEKVKAGFGVTVVQTQPEFPGGADSLLSYLKRNLQYPKEAQAKKEEGQVYVGFMVDTLGKIQDARVVSGITASLDSEALRVVQAMPDWKPGTAGGSAINVHYILPVDFVLPKQQ